MFISAVKMDAGYFNVGVYEFAFSLKELFCTVSLTRLCMCLGVKENFSKDASRDLMCHF